MKKENYLKRSLKLEDYCNGVKRIASFLFEQALKDEFLSQKAVELKKWEAELFALVGKKEEARIGIRAMSNQLTREVTALRFVLKSHAAHCGKDDGSETMESVKAVKEVLANYGLISQMSVKRKITVASAIVRDLRADEVLPHVERLGVEQNVNDIETAIAALENQQDLLVDATQSPEVRVRLVDLKNGSEEAVNAVGHYLQGMIQVNPDAYQGLWNKFCNRIDDANRHPRRNKDDSQDDSSDAQVVSIGHAS